MENKETTATTETTEAKYVEVPTQFAQAIQLVDGTVIEERELLLKIFNDVQLLKKKLL